MDGSPVLNLADELHVPWAATAPTAPVAGQEPEPELSGRRELICCYRPWAVGCQSSAPSAANPLADPPPPGCRRLTGAAGPFLVRAAPQHDATSDRLTRPGRQRVLQNAVCLDHASANQMLLDDPFQHQWVTLSIPGTFGIDHRDRPALADAETVGLGAQDAPLFGQSELPQATLQELPRPPTRAPDHNTSVWSGRSIAGCADAPPAHRSPPRHAAGSQVIRCRACHRSSAGWRGELAEGHGQQGTIAQGLRSDRAHRRHASTFTTDCWTSPVGHEKVGPSVTMSPTGDV